MITVDSPIVGNGGPLDVEIDITHVQRSNDVDAYFRELYRLCEFVGFDYRILVAQSAHETANWTSSWWNQRLNPAGIGITGDPAQDAASHTWANGTEAARAHLIHMVAYVAATLPPDSELPRYLGYDPRYQAVFDAHLNGTVRVLGDLGNGKWATDPNYAEQIAAKANAIFKEEPSVTLYQIVGLPGPGIELPVPLSHDIIGLDQPNQRPGIKRQLPGYWVQHETANEAAGADAAMHARYLSGGADGSQVSWHFSVDDHSIYQHIPIDEVTWQAADSSGPGNMSGVSCEMCVNVDGDETAARHNTEALCAAICGALGLGIDRVKRHYDFNAADPNRHHCPDHMMTQGYWPTFVANVGKIIAPAIVTPSLPVPTIPWSASDIGVVDWNGTQVNRFLGAATAKRNVPIRVAADSNAAVIGTVPKGSVSTARGVFRTTKNRWLLIDLGDKGVGRALLSAFAERWPLP